MDALREVEKITEGKKTYLVGALMIAYAIVMSYLFSYMEVVEANKLIMEGLGLIFLRKGVEKIQK